MKIRAGLLVGVLVLATVTGCVASKPTALPSSATSDETPTQTTTQTTTTPVMAAPTVSQSAAPTPGAAGPVLPRLVARPATASPSARRDPPARFAVAAVDLDLPVAAIGVDAAGLLALPPDPSTIGWYEYGPTTVAPAGSTLLAGHLDSLRYGLGPLVRLRDVVRGDVITVTTASGRVSRYKVSDVERVRKADLAGLGVFDRTGARLLRVVTCGGPFNRETGYRDNLVVTATPAG
jgi:hypothetical protein